MPTVELVLLITFMLVRISGLKIIFQKPFPVGAVVFVAH